MWLPLVFLFYCPESKQHERTGRTGGQAGGPGQTVGQSPTDGRLGWAAHGWWTGVLSAGPTRT
jgi:hypothetical protein